MTLHGWPEALAWAAFMWFVVRPLGTRWTRAASSRLTGAQEARLVAGFEALGPARVVEGLTARGHEWQDCFLATAYGLAGHPGSRLGVGQRWRLMRELGIAVTGELVRAWDQAEGEFREVAAAWLAEQGPPPLHNDPLPVVVGGWGSFGGINREPGLVAAGDVRLGDRADGDLLLVSHAVREDVR